VATAEDISHPAFHLGLSATAKDAVRVLTNALKSRGMDYYNCRCRHGTIKNMAPMKFYEAFLHEQVPAIQLVACLSKNSKIFSILISVNG